MRRIVLDCILRDGGETTPVYRVMQHQNERKNDARMLDDIKERSIDGANLCIRKKERKKQSRQEESAIHLSLPTLAKS